MNTILTWIIGCFAALCAVPTVTVFVELFASRRNFNEKPRPAECDLSASSLAVLIPAHNEEAGIRTTLRHLFKDLPQGARIVVVADNCDDNTSAYARSAGADVIERCDTAKKGKDYAIHFGLNYLASEPPDVVILIDADCATSPGSIKRLAVVCMATGRPVQSLDLMTSPPGSTSDASLAEFAWRLKNWARPMGLKRLGLPCQLMGTGMAFPWWLIETVFTATGSIVEDLYLGLVMAKVGSPPIFEPTACVYSYFPSSADAALSQRTRWEIGHLSLIGRILPQMLWRATIQRNLPLLALVLDAAVPPLALLGATLAVACALSVSIWVTGGSSVPLFINLTSITLLLCGVFVGWWKFGRDLISPKVLLRTPMYFARKLPIYRNLVSRRTIEWTRTDRERK